MGCKERHDAKPNGWERKISLYAVVRKRYLQSGGNDESSKLLFCEVAFSQVQVSDRDIILFVASFCTFHLQNQFSANFEKSISNLSIRHPNVNR